MSLKLKSQEGKIVEISNESAAHSNFLNSKIGQNDPLALEYPENVLVCVKDFLDNFDKVKKEKIEAPVEAKEIKTIIGEWSADFIEKTSFETNFHLINAALSLELENLHDIACVRIAVFMRDRNPEEVQKEFTIECQITSEEAKALGLETDQ